MKHSRPDRSSILAALLLLAALLFNLVALYPELAFAAPDLNDNALHFALVQRAAEALERGEDPTDPWVSYFVQGYPLFHHYQHLPHVATALLHRLLGGTVSLFALFKWLNFLILGTFPLSIYWAGRRLGFSALPAAAAALLASLLATDGLYGLDFASYVWRGYGMTTQLWGMWLLGPAIAGFYQTVRQGRSYAGTAALLAATLLTHTVLGYVALLSGLLLILLTGRVELARRLGRTLLLLLIVAVLASYFLVPFFLDRLYLNRSVWEGPDKYGAYGWEWTLKALVTGQLLDFDRFPSLTLLAGLGLVACLLRWRRDPRCRFILAFFVFWLLLYFGRPTWGVLLDLLPLGRDLHLHRLIAPVHLGAIALAGAGLTTFWGWALARKRAWLLVGAGLLTAALLAPVYAERAEYLALNFQWERETRDALQAESSDLGALLAALRALPPGRVYAGRAANWGADYKIGSVPVYLLLAVNRFDNPAYLYHALSLNADIEGYLDESRLATFDLLNLRYVVAPSEVSPPAFARLLGEFGRHRLYQVETGGYFGLVDSDFALYGQRPDWFKAISAWIQSPMVEAQLHPRILLNAGPPSEGGAIALSDAPALLWTRELETRSPCGKVAAEQSAGNRYSVQFETSRACWLMLKATFHPDWQATLDGQPAETHMLAPSFVGIQVQPGQHWAELEYQPGPLRAWLRAAGLLALLLVALAERQCARWERQAQRLLAPVAQLTTPLAPVWERFWACLARLWQGEARWIAALLAFALLVGLPTLQLQVMSGHDALEYLPRTVEFYRGLSEGHLFPRWAPDLSGGYGQPFFIYNPPLIYYAASALHALGISIVASLDLACLSLLALAGLGSYALSREFFGRAGGLAAGVAYLLAPFTLVNLYVRHALADFAAMAFIPWAFWGLLRWTRRRPAARHLLVTSGAVALLTLSSNPVALVSVPALALYLAFLAWRGKSWRLLLRGGAALGLGLGLAAFFWLPALAERGWVKTHQLLSGYLNYANHFVYPHQLLASPWGYGLSLPGPQDGMSFGLGLAHLFLLGATLLLLWRARQWPPDSQAGRAQVGFFVGLLFLAAFLSSTAAAWLWRALPLLQYLEFPWRILVLAALATAFIAGFPFLLLREPRQRRLLLLTVLAALLLTGLPRAKPETTFEVTDADYSPENIAAYNLAVTTTREYEPIWVQAQPQPPPPANRLLVLSGGVRELESHLEGARYSWLLEASRPTQLRVTTFYFPGWKLTVDGQPRTLRLAGPDGLMGLTLEPGLHRVTLSFDLTPLRRWAIGLSAVSLLLLALWAVRQSSARTPPGR